MTPRDIDTLLVSVDEAVNDWVDEAIESLSTAIECVTMFARPRR